jgi:hypothetical protein
MVPLSQFLDGETPIQTCQEEETACDRCGSLSLLTDAPAPTRLQGNAVGQCISPAPESEPEPKPQPEPQNPQAKDSYRGPQLLQRHTRENAFRLQAFTRQLELLRDSCVLCRFIGNTLCQRSDTP